MKKFDVEGQTLQEVERLNLGAGVLDMKWCPDRIKSVKNETGESSVYHPG